MNQKKWLVSILICTYNASETIFATIQSCLNQTYSNIEILIHDDQSVDKTLEIIKNIWDEKIKIIYSWQKLWPYWWLNFLLDHACGEYIAIQDHDDLRHPEKIEKQINFLKNNKEYIWCGTKTLMRYEWDQKGFEYFLWEKNYYTIHPSLVFRNGSYRYPTDTSYMVDAYFQKMKLCKWWEKLIYNTDETLTLHLVKAGAKNYSYKWFRYSLVTMRTIFTLHPLWYGVLIIGRETMRKIVYPLLQYIDKGSWIDKIERIPFSLLGNKIENYPRKKIIELGFYDDLIRDL